MAKKLTKIRAKKAQKTKQAAPVQKDNLTTIRVATIWKNQTKVGKPFYSLVLETGERLTSFDSGVVFLAGGDAKQRVNNFNPPAVLEGHIVERGGYKHFELPKDSKKQSPQAAQAQATTYKRSQEEADSISRMSILRTAAMLMEYEKTKSMKRFAELIKICEKYVFEGKVE